MGVPTLSRLYVDIWGRETNMHHDAGKHARQMHLTLVLPCEIGL